VYGKRSYPGVYSVQLRRVETEENMRSNIASPARDKEAREISRPRNEVPVSASLDIVLIRNGGSGSVQSRGERERKVGWVHNGGCDEVSEV